MSFENELSMDRFPQKKEIQVKSENINSDQKNPQNKIEMNKKNTNTSPIKRNISFAKRNDGLNILLERRSSRIKIISPNGTETVTTFPKTTFLNSEVQNYFIVGESEKNTPEVVNKANNTLIHKFSNTFDTKSAQQRRSTDDQNDIIELFHLRKNKKNKYSDFDTKQSINQVKTITSEKHIQNEKYYQSLGISAQMFNLISVINFIIFKKQKLYTDESFDKIFNCVVEAQLLNILTEFYFKIKKSVFLDDLKKLKNEVFRRNQIKEHAIYIFSFSQKKKKKACFLELINSYLDIANDEDLILSKPNSFIGKSIKPY
jgi:hypothetical protein